MLRINLLPEDDRKGSLTRVEQFHRTPVVWILVLIMLAVPLSLWIPITIRRRQLAPLTAKVQVLEPKRVVVLQLQEALKKLQAQDAAFRGMDQGQGLWSQRFNTLSDMTPAGVWFTELSLEQEKGLVIQGSAIGHPGEAVFAGVFKSADPSLTDPGMVSVTRLVHSLQSDAQFMSVIEDIQIESIKRAQEGEVEVMHFTLHCPLRKPADASA